MRSAPSIDENLPVSRQHELALSDYFGWPQYWYRTEPLGYPFVPTFMDYEPANTTTVNELREQVEQRLSRADKHLRSSSEVIRYDVITSDERRLKLQDMLIGVGDWDIPFVVIGASRHAQRHLAPTVYAGDINFSEQLLAMNLSEEKILASHPIHFDAPQFEEMRAISLHYFGASQRERPGDELSA